MFLLTKYTPAYLRSVTVRAEMHGTEPVPALTLYLVQELPNTVLDMFDPNLRRMLYRAAADDEEQPPLDGVDLASDTPTLRSQVLKGPFELASEYKGRNLTIEYGRSGVGLMCDVDSFKFEPMVEGGIELEYRLQASGVDDSHRGKITGLLKHNINVKLEVSEAAEGPGPDLLTPLHQAKKLVVDTLAQAPDAGDIFAATHGNGKAAPKVTFKAKAGAAAAKKAAAAAKKGKGARS